MEINNGLNNQERESFEQSGDPTSDQMVSKPKKEGRVGPAIGSTIIIILIILGGIYFWGSIIEKNKSQEMNNQTPDVINADLDINELDEIDEDLNTINSEIDASL